MKQTIPGQRSLCSGVFSLLNMEPPDSLNHRAYQNHGICFHYVFLYAFYWQDRKFIWARGQSQNEYGFYCGTGFGAGCFQSLLFYFSDMRIMIILLRELLVSVLPWTSSKSSPGVNDPLYLLSVSNLIKTSEFVATPEVI